MRPLNHLMTVCALLAGLISTGAHAAANAIDELLGQDAQEQTQKNRDQKIENPPGLATDAPLEAEPLRQGHQLLLLNLCGEAKEAPGEAQYLAVIAVPAGQSRSGWGRVCRGESQQ